MPAIDFPLLRVLRLKGMADVQTLARALRVDVDTMQSRAEACVLAGDARTIPRGTMLTPQGRENLAKALEAELGEIDRASVDAIYEPFCTLNTSFKQLMKDWQIRLVDGAEVPNDHLDQDYDAAILERLAAVDAGLAPMLTQMVVLVPRLEPYPARFADALAALQAGDRSMMAAPIKDSYHTVWFEFHEDMIGLCGLTRAGEAAAGRGD